MLNSLVFSLNPETITLLVDFPHFCFTFLKDKIKDAMETLEDHQESLENKQKSFEDDISSLEVSLLALQYTES